MQRAARKDANHQEIVKYCRELGYSVLDIAQLKNACDIFISKNGHTIAIEIKDGAKPPSQRKLTEGEQKFKDNWKGAYKIVISKADIDTIELAINNLI